MLPPGHPAPQAFAASNDLRSAAKYYKQLRRSGRSGLAAVSVSQRRMWELLIENYCRQVGGPEQPWGFRALLSRQQTGNRCLPDPSS